MVAPSGPSGPGGVIRFVPKNLCPFPYKTRPERNKARSAEITERWKSIRISGGVFLSGLPESVFLLALSALSSPSNFGAFRNERTCRREKRSQEISGFVTATQRPRAALSIVFFLFLLPLPPGDFALIATLPACLLSCPNKFGKLKTARFYPRAAKSDSL